MNSAETQSNDNMKKKKNKEEKCQKTNYLNRQLGISKIMTKFFSVWYRNFSHYLVWLTLPHFKNSEVLIIPVIDDYQWRIYFWHVGAAVPVMQAMTSSFVIG